MATRTEYRETLRDLLSNPNYRNLGKGEEGLALDAHLAKYACVLTSGYLEHSIQEILLEFVESKTQSRRVISFSRNSWPRSMNMNPYNIKKILNRFDEDWKVGIRDWFNEDRDRERNIENLVKMRNAISHGKEADATVVTFYWLRPKFRTACELVDKIEEKIQKALR